jgi:acetoin:2,6-dichlorophenolindophenol oxidoreductase subunit alpha
VSEPLDLLQAYTTMVRIRAFEQRAGRLFAAGELPGFIHLSIGQEAVAVGAVSALRGTDQITLTHRGHGQMIAKGGQLEPMMAELMGREGGYCHGKGGSMHLFSFDLGILGANGILGAAQPIAVGAALSAQLRGSDDVIVTFLGEGASAQGAVHEAMTLAAVWRLPIVFCFEVNGFAELSPYSVHVSVDSLAERGAAYGMPGISVDGSDVQVVHDAVAEAVERARRGEGPSIVEARTVRWSGHYEGDPQKYRDEQSMASREPNDPIALLGRRLVESGRVDAAALQSIADEAERELDAAVEAAKASPAPTLDAAFAEVFA